MKGAKISAAALLTVLAGCQSSGFRPTVTAPASAGVAVIHIMPPLGGRQPMTTLPYGSAPIRYHQGVVQVKPRIYLIFWGFHHGGDPDGEAARLTSFFKAVGGSAWLSTVTQYYETRLGAKTFITNPSVQLRGVYYDDNTPIPSPLTEPDVLLEAATTARYFGIPVTTQSGVFIVATPHGHNTTNFGVTYCGYHSFGPSAYNGPWFSFAYVGYTPDAKLCGRNKVNRGSAGAMDGATIIAGHELAETLTDPQVTGWYDAIGNNVIVEIGDKCAWVDLQNTPFGHVSYPTQPLWSDRQKGCVQ
jgi:hypothetical protein